jgi:two-component system sensor histidine kinase YesM
MKLGIKGKILGITGLVVTISLLLSGTLAYYYFKIIFKEKATKDEINRINQIAQQMEYQIKDIRKHLTGIMITPEIQSFVKKTSYTSVYERLITTRNALSIISNQNFLREFIHSTAIMTRDGSVWYTDMYTMPHDYFRGKLAENWYQKYLKANEQYYFTDPYNISDATHGAASKRVISCIARLHDIDHPSKIIGRIFLNVFTSHFEKIITLNSTDYDAFFWASRDGALMYQKNKLKYKLKIKEILASYQDYQQTIVIDNTKGYFIFNRPLSNGWRLISFTSHQKLYYRICFILYFFLCFTLISLAIIIIIIFPTISRITKPLSDLTAAMEKVSTGDLNTSLRICTGDELETIAVVFNKMVVDLKSYIAKSVDYEKNKRKMEFDLLLSQINPHFIYNILNTVIYLARKQKNFDVVNLVDSFIRVLQDGIKISDGGLNTTIKQEMEIVNHYVRIQQYRYRKRFKLIWDVDNNLLDNLIPKTLIQPLVENALYHGICPKDGRGEITVQIKKEGDDLVITVHDDGVGMEKEMIEKLLNGDRIYTPESQMRSLGLANTHERIRYLYGEKYGIQIESIVHQGTKVIVHLPFHPE